MFDASLRQSETAAQSEVNDARDKVGRLISNPFLQDVGGSRMTEKLRAVVYDTKLKGSKRQQEALYSLRRLPKHEAKKEIFMRLVKSNQHLGAMGPLSQFATDCWDKEVVDVLFAVYRSADSGEEDRNWAKNGLQTIRNKAESAGDSAMVKRIETELK